MLKHHLILFFRNIKRNKSTFLINLIGLSTGLACVLLIYLWINDELSVDKFHEKDDQLYQVMQNLLIGNDIVTTDYTPGLLASTLAEEMPEVEFAAAAFTNSFDYGTGVSVDGNHLKTSEKFVTEDFFNVFSYQLIQGDKDKIFPDKNSVLISDELATLLFNTTENIIGKTITWNQVKYNGLYTVSGLFKNPPVNSTDQFDLLFSYDLLLEKRPNLLDWGNSDPSTYVVLKSGTDIEKFNEKIKDLRKSKHKGAYGTLFARKYSDKYLYNHYENGVQAGGRITYVRLFSIIALIILLIACINFMNLSTAKTSGRMREVGVKKAVGAGRESLIVQYLGESILMASVSMFLAVLLVELVLPQFNTITGKQLALVWNNNLILSLFSVTFITGLIAGSYPAIYLSGFKPALVLKGRLSSSIGELWVRKGLVIIQFTVSISFMVLVLVVYRQMAFVQSETLGYDRDNVIYFQKDIEAPDDFESYFMDGKMEKDIETFLHEVQSIPGVVNASNFFHNLTGDHGGTGAINWEGKNPDEKVSFANLEAGFNFIETLGIEMTAGRPFSRELSSEHSKVIFNEAAIERMGLTDPIGKRVRIWGQEREIIGVTKNFHFESLYENVKPCFFTLTPRAQNIMVRIRAGSETATIDQLRHVYKQFNPGSTFEYRFMDQDYQALYTAEQRVSSLSKYFAGIAILISCLGLFGLAAHTAEQRTKEIGVRKVLGATVSNIVGLLSKDFVKLVLIGFVIAAPIAWYIMNQWLADFAYRVEIGPGIFAIAGGTALLIALATVSWQSVRAAVANPVESLRSE